ncbi:hypothetical protein B0H14DRAFT_2894425, partial [Mycena olivaceomarginata]
MRYSSGLDSLPDCAFPLLCVGVVAGLSLGSPAVMAFRPTAKPKEGQHRAELCLVLHHGDILVMEGTGIQHYYQSVQSLFRFAGLKANALTIGTPSNRKTSESLSQLVTLGLQVVRRHKPWCTV